MSSAAGSLFARLYAGHTGVDPYTTAVSDTYQDLFGEGIFTGKGLYDVDAFMAALEGRVPENALLSHDLFEGLHARAALVSDVEVVDDYPVERAGPRAPAAPLGARRLADPALAVPARAHRAAGLERNRLPLDQPLEDPRQPAAQPRGRRPCCLLLAAAWTVLPGRAVRLDGGGRWPPWPSRSIRCSCRPLRGPRPQQPAAVFLKHLARGPEDGAGAGAAAR